MRKSECLTNHRRSLRDRAFAQRLEAEEIAAKKAIRLGSEIEAEAPIYRRIWYRTPNDVA